jgi:hypothetical protein
MTAFLLALALLAGNDAPPAHLEAALFLPQPGVNLNADRMVVYGNQGVVLVPQARGDLLGALFNGAAGRFVSTGVAPVSGPQTIVLPLASGDLDGAAAGRALSRLAINPSGVRLDLQSAAPP